MPPGRSIIARAEGKMKPLPAFSDCVMLLYGMDGDLAWSSRHTRFLGEDYAGEELGVKYIASEKRMTKATACLQSTLKSTGLRTINLS